MTTLHTSKPRIEPEQIETLADLVVQSDLEREVLALLRRLDEESQVGALMILQGVERRVTRVRGS